MKARRDWVQGPCEEDWESSSCAGEGVGGQRRRRRTLRVGTKCLETLGNLPATVDGPINIQRKRTASDVAK